MRHLLKRSLRHWLAGLMVSALLATQWAAVVHGASGHGRQSAHAAIGETAALSAAHGVQAVVPSHDEGSAFCQVLDHCLHGGAIAAHPLQLGDVAPSRAAWPAVADIRLEARWGAYLARAPPAPVPTMHLA